MKIKKIIVLLLISLINVAAYAEYFTNQHLEISTPLGEVEWELEFGESGSKFVSNILTHPKRVSLVLAEYWDLKGGTIQEPGNYGRSQDIYSLSNTYMNVRCDKYYENNILVSGMNTYRQFNSCSALGEIYAFLEINSFSLANTQQNRSVLGTLISGSDKAVSGYYSKDNITGYFNQISNTTGIAKCSYEEKYTWSISRFKMDSKEIVCKPFWGDIDNNFDRPEYDHLPVPNETYKVLETTYEHEKLLVYADKQDSSIAMEEMEFSSWVYNTETNFSYKYVGNAGDQNMLPVAVRSKNGHVLNIEWPEQQGNTLTPYPKRIYDDNNNTIVQWDLEFVKEEAQNDEGETYITKEKYLVRKITDYSGRSVSYSYDGFELVSQVDAMGNIWKYVRDSFKRGEYDYPYLKAIEDPEGNVTEFLLEAQEASRGTGYRTAAGEGYIHYSVYEEEGLVATETVTKEYHSGRIEERIYEYVFEELPLNRDGSVNGSGKTQKSKLLSQIKTNGEVTMDIVEKKEKELPYILYDRSITDGAGYEYDIKSKFDISNNFISGGNISVIYPNGEEYHVGYDDFSNVTSVSRVLTKTDSKTTYASEALWNYGEYNQLTYEVNASGEKVEYDYDASGNLITERYVGNDNTQTVEFKYEYDSYNRLVKETDPEGGVIQYQDFHVTGQAQKVIDELGRITTYEYDLNGNLKSWQDPLQRKQLIFYDKRNEYYKKIRPDNSVVQYSLDGDGYALTETDELGHAIEYVYDGGHRVTQYKEPKDSSSSQQRIWEYAYNYDDKLIQEQEPGSHISKWDYQNGQLKAVEYPNRKVDLDYYPLGQVKKANWKANNGKNKTYQYGYDVLGSLTSFSDTLNNAIKYEKDGAGRVLTATDASGAVTQYEWDNRGNLLKITDPENKTFTFEYNKNNWLTKEIRNNGETREFSYYPNGNFKQLTDAKGQIARFTFNDGDELTKVEHFSNAQDITPVKTINYTYDLRGRMLSWNDGSSSAAYQYNLRGDLTQVTQSYPAGFSKTQKYSYFPNGNLKSYENPEGIIYSYNYNKNNNLQTVLIPGVGQMIYSNFDWHIPNQLMYPGGSKLDLSRDGYDNLTGFSLVDANGQSVANNTYQVDAVDNVTQIKDSAGTHDLEYTDKYELAKHQTTHNGVTTEQVFDYDGVSNRLSSSNSASQQDSIWQYNGNHQLEQMGNVSFEYDANGALIKRTTQQGDTVTSLHYVYDTSDRLIEIKDTAQQTIAQYGYDIFGYRIWKKVFSDSGSTTTHFLYNQSGLAGEYDGTGKLIAEYHYSPAKGWGIEPLFTRQNGQAYFYQNDVRNAPERLIDTAGKVVWQAQYNAFGEASILKADIKNPIRFPGQYFDNETGLHYNLMRYYDPKLGRYLREDPLGIYGDGVNLYSYAKQSPFKYIDPDGRNPVIGGIVCMILNGGCWDWSCAIPGGFGKGAGKGLGGLFGGGKGKGGKGGKGNDKGNDKDKDKDDDKNKEDDCGCFTGDTQVAIQEDENTKEQVSSTPQLNKAIRDITIGDMVLAKNVATGEVDYKPVAQLFSYDDRAIYELTLQEEGGEFTYIEVTDDHPFWVADFGWMDSIDLVPGLNVDTRSGKILTVIDLKFLNRFEKVYNFEVSDWHTYFVSGSGVLVHNAKRPCDDDDDDIVEHDSKKAARRAAEREAGMGKHGGRTKPEKVPSKPGSQSPQGDPGNRTEVTSTDTGTTVHHDPHGHKFPDGDNIPPHYGVDRPGGGTTHHTYPSPHNPANNR